MTKRQTPAEKNRPNLTGRPRCVRCEGTNQKEKTCHVDRVQLRVRDVKLPPREALFSPLFIVQSPMLFSLPPKVKRRGWKRRSALQPSRLSAAHLHRPPCRRRVMERRAAATCRREATPPRRAQVRARVSNSKHFITGASSEIGPQIPAAVQRRGRSTVRD